MSVWPESRSLSSKKEPHSSRLQNAKRETQNDDDEKLMKGCLNASNWIASFIRRDNAGWQNRTRRAFVPYFREKKARPRDLSMDRTER